MSFHTEHRENHDLFEAKDGFSDYLLWSHQYISIHSFQKTFPKPLSINLYKNNYKYHKSIK